MDPRHSLAYDYLGLVDEQTDRIDEAIADYTHELALDPKLGRSRLAEVYCNRGQSHLREKRYEPAAADLEKSIELGGAADGCSCEPFNSLAFIYIDAEQRYDKGWELVHKARNSGQFVAPEYVERLKKGSGRDG
jgi:tetratricopeptide (TPR) repeat protein